MRICVTSFSDPSKQLFSFNFIIMLYFDSAPLLQWRFKCDVRAIKSMRETFYVECAFVLSRSLIPRSNYSLSILPSCSILTRRLFSNSDLSVLYELSNDLNIVTLQERLDLLTSFSSIEASSTVSEGRNVN